MNNYNHKKLSDDSHFFIKHQEHFNENLIQLVKNFEKSDKKHKDNEVIYKATIKRDKAEIESLKHINREQVIREYNMKNSFESQIAQLEEKIKDLEKESNRRTKIIDNELNKSHIDNTRLHEENYRIKKEIEKLRQENNKYKRKVNSSNSSIPPSLDPNRPVRSLKELSTKKIGGQIGHEPHLLKLSDKPDKVIEKRVRKIPAGAQAYYENRELKYFRVQEINATFKTEVIETRYFMEPRKGLDLSIDELKKYCANAVVYSEGFKSILLYLNSKGAIALDRLCIMINELSNNEINVRPSSIVNWQREFYIKSVEYRGEILKDILNSRIIHTDETGWKINGKRAWLHVINTTNGVHFIITEKRGDETSGPLKILEEYKYILVHDHFKPYYKLVKCIHVECNIHIIRYA